MDGYSIKRKARYLFLCLLLTLLIIVHIILFCVILFLFGPKSFFFIFSFFFFTPFFLSFFFTQTSISRDLLEQCIIALSSHIKETNQSPAFVMNINVNNSESHFSLDSLKTEAAYFFSFGADFYSNERLRVRDPRFVNLSKRQHQCRF